MKLTILGSSAAYPGPGKPCSGYLLQGENRDILVDCGCGVLGNLQEHIDLRRVSDIIITHMHADHFFDLVPYRYALEYGLANLGTAKPKLHLPPNGAEALNQVVSPFSESDTFFADAFDVSEYNPDELLLLGQFEVKFIPVRHYIPTYALSITGSRKLTITSDSGSCPALVEIARDADVLLCNVGRCLGAEITHLWGHLLPEEAGELAKEAGVKRLMLTHLWPSCNPKLSLQEASAHFGGETELAEIHHTYVI